MKKFIALLLLTPFIIFSSERENNIPNTSKKPPRSSVKPFKKGEYLKFKVSYGVFDAGIAELELKEDNKQVGDIDLIHAVGIGTSEGFFDWFFKVRDRYETYMNAEEVEPVLFIRRVNEGGFKINQDYKFYHNKNIVDNGKGEKFSVPDDIQDMLSAFYYARTIDVAQLQKGDIVTIETFMDNEVYPLDIRFMGYDTVKTKLGKFSCVKFTPAMQMGRIFKDEEDMAVWLTNDKNKLPVFVKADILVGSIRMELTEMKNTAHPIARVK